MASKLRELESQVVKGGRNILDTYSERQTELEKRLHEIAERKVSGSIHHIFVICVVMGCHKNMLLYNNM